MKRPESIRQLKSKWQRDIRNGIIANHSQMLDLISGHGFSIKASGKDFVTFRDSDGKSARVYFSFPNPTATMGTSASIAARTNRHLSPSGGWVYSLIVETSPRISCYIGQTVNLPKRLLDHARRVRPERASGPLFSLADEANLDVKVAVLDFIPKQSPDKHDFISYVAAESMWFGSAVRAGLFTPDSTKWGKMPPESGCGEPWPFDQIAKSAVPIAFAADYSVDPLRYSIASVLLKFGSPRHEKSDSDPDVIDPEASPDQRRHPNM